LAFHVCYWYCQTDHVQCRLHGELEAKLNSCHSFADPCTATISRIWINWNYQLNAKKTLALYRLPSRLQEIVVVDPIHFITCKKH